MSKRLIGLLLALMLVCMGAVGMAASEYTITFHANGGSGSMNSATVTAGEEYTLPDCTFAPASDQVEFYTWELIVDGEVKGEFDVGSTFAPSHDCAFHAKWVEKSTVEYTLTIDTGTKDVELIETTAKAGESFELPSAQVLPVFRSEDGYAYLKWVVTKTASGEKVGEYVGFAFVTATEDMTATAVWADPETILHTVSFSKGSDAAGGSMPAMQVHPGEYTLPPCGFNAPEEMRFLRWRSSGQYYQPNETFVICSNTNFTAEWEAIPTYTVTFDANGGSGTMKPQTFKDGVAQALNANAFEREGYEFIGWNTAADASGDSYSATGAVMIEKDCALYAHWRAKRYEMILAPGEGSGAQKAPQVLPYDYTYTLPSASAVGYSKDGYALTGWNDGTKTYRVGEQYTIKGNVTLTAQWTKQSYTITFVGEEGSMDSVTKEHGDIYVLPECEFSQPINHVFKAWDVNGMEYTVGYPVEVTGDLTVTPVWEWISYTVKFDAQGGSGTMESVSVLAGTAFAAPQCGFTAPQSMVFEGWHVDDELSEGHYKVGDEIYVYSDITLKAGWTKRDRVITYKSGSGSDALIHEVPILSGTAHTLLNSMFTAPEGKQFRCWLFLVPPTFKETEELDPGMEFSRVNADLTFIADWETIKYAVTFDANGGTGKMNAAQVEHGTQYKIPGCAFAAPTGYGFKCWSLNGSELAGDAVIPVTESMSLKAVWQKDVYTLSLVDSNDSSAVMTEQVEYGAKYTLPACPFEPDSEYHTFSHWKMESAAGTAELAKGAVITIDSSVKLTAMWDFDNSVQTKIEQVEDISALPPAQKAEMEAELFAEMPKALKTVDAVVEELTEQATKNTAFEPENVEVHDVKLMFKPAGSEKWIEADKDNFPTAGIEVRMPIPEGANATDFDFMVIHMFTVDSERLGIKAGDTETVVPEIVGNELVFTLSGLSPVSVAYKVKDNVVPALPETGDPSSLLGWATLLGASGMGMRVMKRRKK